jgi:Tfp pilus assembly protein PilX
MSFNNKKGFTLLLATLISSLLLLLGAAIFSVIKKELVLSSLGRDSQFAFYAADTGAECALYWDFRFNAFNATSTYSSATCDGQSLGDLTFPGFGIPQSIEFQTNGYCVRVDVTKNSTHPRTKIISKGYNTSCTNIGVSRRTLERAVELTY